MRPHICAECFAATLVTGRGVSYGFHMQKRVCGLASHIVGGTGIGRSAEQAGRHLDEANPFISELDGKTAEITL